MATGAMLWGGAAYNNGILPFKQYVAGEYYVTKKGAEAEKAQGGLTSAGAILKGAKEPDDNMKAKGVLPLFGALAGLGVVTAGGYIPGLRTGRAKYRQSFSGNRTAQRHRSDPAR